MKIKIPFIVIVLSILLSCNAAYGIMVQLSYDQIWTEADTAVSGRVVEINHYWAPGGLIYRIMKMETENFYKNPLDVDSLYIRVEGGKIREKQVVVSDEPELKIGQHVLLFLTLTSEKHEGESVYRVYGGPQGKFVIKENRANNGDIYLDITEGSIIYRPGGEAYLVDTIFDGFVSVNERHLIGLVVHNDGPQPAHKDFNITFVGVEGSATGRNVTNVVRGGADPGKYFTFTFEVRFSEPGVYVMLVDGVSYDNFTVIGRTDQIEPEPEPEPKPIQEPEPELEPEQEPEPEPEHESAGKPETEVKQKGIHGFLYIAIIIGLVIVLLLRDRIHY